MSNEKLLIAKGEEEQKTQQTILHSPKNWHGPDENILSHKVENTKGRNETSSQEVGIDDEVQREEKEKIINGEDKNVSVTSTRQRKVSLILPSTTSPASSQETHRQEAAPKHPYLQLRGKRDEVVGWRYTVKELFFPFHCLKNYNRKWFPFSRGIYENCIILVFLLHIVFFGVFYSPYFFVWRDFRLHAKDYFTVSSSNDNSGNGTAGQSSLSSSSSSFFWYLVQPSSLWYISTHSAGTDPATVYNVPRSIAEMYHDFEFTVQNQTLPAGIASGSQREISDVYIHQFLSSSSKGSLSLGIQNAFDQWLVTNLAQYIPVIEWVFTSIYALDVLLHLISFGTYTLSSSGKLIAFFLPFASMILLILYTAKLPTLFFFVSAFRIVRFLRPVFNTRRFTALRVAIASIKLSLVELGDVMLLLLIFLIWFAVAGVHQFGSDLSNKCVSESYFNGTWALHEIYHHEVHENNNGNRKFEENMVFSSSDNINGTEAPISTSLLHHHQEWSDLFFWLQDTRQNLTFISDYICGGIFDQRLTKKLGGATKVTGGQSDLGCNADRVCMLDYGSYGSSVVRGYSCPYGYRCVPHVFQRDVDQMKNKEYHLLFPNAMKRVEMRTQNGFENTLKALLTVFTSVSFAGTYTVMFALRDATNLLAYVYFMSLIAVGGFILINLFLFVVTTQFQRQRHLISEQLKAKLLFAAEKMKEKAKMEGGQPRGETLGEIERQQAEEKPSLASVALKLMSSKEKTAADEDRQCEEMREITMPLVSTPLEDDEKQTTKADRISAARSSSAFSSISQKLESIFAPIVADDKFENVTTFMISLNLLVLCGYQHSLRNSPSATQFFEISNVIFVVEFTMETCFRFLATGLRWRSYFSNFYNCVDVLVLIVPMLEMVTFAFRSLRTLRCLKLLRQFPSISAWITAVGNSVRVSPFPLTLLLLLVIVFSLVGVQVFGGRFCGLVSDEKGWMAFRVVASQNLSSYAAPHQRNYSTSLLSVSSDLSAFRCPGLPRAHFDSFGQSLLTTIQFLTTDDWNTIMFHAMASSGWAWCLLFIVAFIFGVLIILNLLIAILLSSAEETQQTLEDSTPQRQQKAAGSSSPASGEKEKTTGVKSTLELYEQDDDDTQEERAKAPWLRKLEKKLEYGVILAIIVASVSMALEDRAKAPDTSYARILYFIDAASTVVYTLEVTVKCLRYGLIRGEQSFLRRSHWNKLDFFLVLISVVGIVPVSLVGFGSQLKTRLRVIKVLRAFRPLLLLTHIPGFRLALYAVYCSIGQMGNVFFVGVIFLLMWSITATFLFAGKLRVCRMDKAKDTWCPGCNLQECSAKGGEFKNNGPNFDHVLASMLTLFQVVTLRGWSGIMYRVMDVTAFGEPVQRDANAPAAIFIVVFMFFGGLFYANIFGSVLLTTYNALSRSGRYQRYITRKREFEALHSTFRRVLDARDHLKKLRLKLLSKVMVKNNNASPLSPDFGSPTGLRKKKSNNHSAATSSSFTEQDLIATLSDFYNSSEQDVTNTLPLSNSSYLSLDEQRQAKRGALLQRMPLSRRIAEHKHFKKFVDLSIFINFIVLAVEQRPEHSETVSLAFNIASGVFSLFFAVELFIKISAYSWRGFWSSGWHKFDMVVTVVTLMTSAWDLLEFLGFESRNVKLGINSLSLINSVRVLRLVQLKHVSSTLEALFKKTVQALVDLVYVASISFVVVFIFAVLGMTLFSLVKQHEVGSGGLDMHTNFHSIFRGMLLLLRALTVGNWPQLMSDCGVQDPKCDPNLNECGQPSPIPQLYFVMYIGVGTFVLQNLVIAVMIETFTQSTARRTLSKERAEIFVHLWEKFDPTLTCKVPAYLVLEIIRLIPSNWVIGHLNRKPKRHRLKAEMLFLRSLQLRTVNELVSFSSVVSELCILAYLQHSRPGEIEETRRKFQKRSKELLGSVSRSDVILWGDDEDEDEGEKKEQEKERAGGGGWTTKRQNKSKTMEEEYKETAAVILLRHALMRARGRVSADAWNEGRACAHFNEEAQGSDGEQ